ncbi:MAG TPA: RNB domain-containing ribonuclease, partial [Solirubrobacteraceae bacterium]|nr:RNB domain-containing ribonuclease [Solirubrobacteraceae bacterium]
MSDVVAVLEKRGRFLVGVPLFPRRESLPPGERQRGRGQLTVDGRRNGRPGQLVLLRVQGQGRGHARIVRTLGRPEVARDVIEGLMLDRELRRSFEPHVEREAREAAQRADTHPRRDLRGLPTFTIDPISARDFDDAISARADEAEGTTRVWVHIADVAAFVREGTALDREAHRRATSVYVPGAVEPMLPDVLSGDACSLRPGQDRLAVTVELSFRAEQVLSASIYRSVIRSDERLDYERVDRLFAGRERPRAPWGEPLQAARAVAAALDEARRRGAALTLEQPESEFELDEEGHVTAVRPRAQTESHRLIEHLMIAANEAVARLLRDRSAPCLYRVHERPDPERVERLVEQLASLEIPTPPLVEHLSSSQAADAVGEASRL